MKKLGGGGTKIIGVGSQKIYGWGDNFFVVGVTEKIKVGW